MCICDSVCDCVTASVSLHVSVFVWCVFVCMYIVYLRPTTDVTFRKYCYADTSATFYYSNGKLFFFLICWSEDEYFMHICFCTHTTYYIHILFWYTHVYSTLDFFWINIKSKKYLNKSLTFEIYFDWIFLFVVLCIPFIFFFVVLYPP